MIYYLGYFSHFDKNLTVAPAANTMMYYVAKAFCSAKNPVTIASPAVSFNKLQSAKASLKKLSENLDYLNAPIYKSYTKFDRKIGTLISQKYIYNYLKTNLKTDDTLIVYHSLYFIDQVIKLKEKRKFNLIIQVCEIYANCINDATKKEEVKKRELDFFKKANSYIFACEALQEFVNHSEKPYAIAYGTYDYESDTQPKVSDGKIHCVYAGTFDSHKAGVTNTVKLEKYLDDKCAIHIIGIGSQDEVSQLQKAIVENNAINDCKITYDGLKMGKDYTDYLSKYHIGLSLQSPIGEYNDTSFSSKILSYLANGLAVVSVDIPAVRNCKIADVLYLTTNEPKYTAEIIKNFNPSSLKKSAEALQRLDTDFRQQITRLIQQ